MNQESTKTTKIAIFRNRKIRKTIHKNEWWFVVEDIVVALTDSSNPKDYINKMRLRDNELSKGYRQIVHTLPIETSGGKQRMNCANTEGIFRIIQSIPSPKAEPFKRWLARVAKTWSRTGQSRHGPESPGRSQTNEIRHVEQVIYV